MVVENYGLYEGILQTLISNLMADPNVLKALRVSPELPKKTIIETALYGPVFTDFCNKCREKDLVLTIDFKKPSLYKTVEAALPIMLTSLASQLNISSELLKFHLKRYNRGFLKITRTILPKVDKAFIPLKKLIEERVRKLYGQDFFTKFSHGTSKEPLFSLMELYSNDQELIDLVEKELEIITSKVSIEGVSKASFKHHWQFMVQSMCPPVLEEKFEEKFLRITHFSVNEYIYLISILITVTNYGFAQQAFEILIQKVDHNPVLFFRTNEIRDALLTPVYSVLKDAINTKKLPLKQALTTVFPVLLRILRIENNSEEYLELKEIVKLFIRQFLIDAKEYASSNETAIELLHQQLIERFIKQYYGNDFLKNYPKLTLDDVYRQDKELMLLVIKEMNTIMNKQKIEMQFNEEMKINKEFDPKCVAKFLAVTGKTSEVIKKEILEQNAIQALTSSKATFLRHVDIPSQNKSYSQDSCITELGSYKQPY